MKQLMNTLEEKFRKWINEIKEAPSKIKELEEDIKYYNMKLIGCNAVSYDRVSTSTTNNSQSSLFMWLSKIEETEQAIEKIISKIKAFNSFVSALTKKEQQVLDMLFMKRFKQKEAGLKLSVSKTRIFEMKSNIIYLSILYM